MKKRLYAPSKILMMTLLTMTFLFSVIPGMADAQEAVQEQIYGYQLMTPLEQEQYRARMHSAATPEERLRIRNEHHERMQVRAREQGVMLPDEPPESGMGQGRGMGYGSGGMGQGGMGSGGGKR
jgi:hypothetical protein